MYGVNIFHKKLSTTLPKVRENSTGDNNVWTKVNGNLPHLYYILRKTEYLEK